MNKREIINHLPQTHRLSLFTQIFPDQYGKEQKEEALIVRPRDFSCMRYVHTLLNDECDGVMSSEYGLRYNKYVIDFCETHGDRQLLADNIHGICGTMYDS